MKISFSEKEVRAVMFKDIQNRKQVAGSDLSMIPGDITLNTLTYFDDTRDGETFWVIEVTDPTTSEDEV